jgi:hypothetical protein
VSEGVASVDMHGALAANPHSRLRATRLQISLDPVASSSHARSGRPTAALPTCIFTLGALAPAAAAGRLSAASKTSDSLLVETTR